MSGSNFTGTTLSGVVPIMTVFTDTSDGIPVAWTWNFGDGTTTTIQNPAHLYTQADSFNVSLTTTTAASSGLTLANPFSAPTSNATVAVAKTGAVSYATGSLEFGATSVYQEYTNTLTRAPAVFNGFSFTFNVERQGASIGLDFAVELTFGTQVIRVGYGTWNFDTAYDGKLYLNDGSTELYKETAAFWPNDNSSATVRLVATATNIELWVNGTQLTSTALATSRAATNSFLSQVKFLSKGYPVISGHDGNQAATFTSYSVTGLAVARVAMPQFTRTAYVTTTINNNPQLSHKKAESFEFTQATESDTWVINHKLGQYPIVDVYIDFNGEKQKILPQAIVYNDKDTCTITFSVPCTGLATVV